MAKGKGRVRVETSGESARTYDVRRGEEVTVRTKRERPEVTGGGGGGGGGGDFNPLGCLFGIIIILVIIYKAVDYSVNMVEVKVIKKIAPTYVTRHEAAEEEKIKRRIKKEEDEKRREKEEKETGKRITRQIEIQRLYEVQNEKLEKTLGGKEKIEKNLKQKGFHFYSSGCFYAIGDCVWSGGNLVIRKDARPFSGRDLVFDNSSFLTMPAVALSEDGGVDWKIYSTLDVGGEGDIQTPMISSIVFLNKNRGFISLFWEYDRIGILSRSSSYIYKTEDGGKNWKIVLRIEKRDYKEPSGNILGIANKIVRIEATDEQHIVAILFSVSDFSSFRADGLNRTIESSDGGKNWTYINGSGVKSAKSCAEELIWRTEKGETIPQF